MDISRLPDALPNELWIQVFQHLSPHDVVRSVARTNSLFRNLVEAHAFRLPLIPVHCNACVLDVEERQEPTISYIFTAYNKESKEYHRRLRDCSVGNDLRFKAVHVQPRRYGDLYCSLMKRDGDVLIDTSQSRIDPETAYSIFSRMRIESLRVDVNKGGKRLLHRAQDDSLCRILDFCKQICGHLELRSLYLTSSNPRFPWQLDKSSVECLLNTRLESFSTDSMHTLDIFSAKNFLPLDCLSNLQLRISQKHRENIHNMMFLDIDGTFLMRLVKHCVSKLDVSLFSACAPAITSISAKDMCAFIRAWRGVISPWRIKGITFNTTTTISEFRTAALNMGLYTGEHLVDIPYCRFRTHHPSDPNMLLELACFANAGATQWTICSGYPRLRSEKQRW